MLALVRSRSSLFLPPLGESGIGDCVVGLAQSNEEIEAIQRLRFEVFSSEYGAKLAPLGSAIDRDAFDPWCEHLMVKDLASDTVVGTYRVLGPAQARRAGGYHAESEFDLSGLGSVKESLVEFGRACIDADYRHGSVVMMLWSGLAEILHQG